MPEVRYRWSRGFRKSTNADGSAGRYSKVTLARVEIEFAKDFERLPEEMLFRSVLAKKRGQKECVVKTPTHATFYRF